MDIILADKNVCLLHLKEVNICLQDHIWLYSLRRQDFSSIAIRLLHPFIAKSAAATPLSSSSSFSPSSSSSSKSLFQFSLSDFSSQFLTQLVLCFSHVPSSDQEKKDEVLEEKKEEE